MEDFDFVGTEDVGAEPDSSVENSVETEPNTEASTETETAQNTEQKPSIAEPQKYTVKVNKQEHKLTLDELIARAQMGMDYDRVKKQVEEMRSNPAMKLLESKAKESGMSVDQYAQALMQAETENRIAERRMQLIDEGKDEATAEYIARLELDANSLKNTVENLTASQRQTQAQRDFVNEQMARFQEKYPDVQDIPDSVIETVKNGTPPVEAYQEYLLSLKEKELQTYKTNDKNKSIDPGSASTQAKTSGDPFDEVFFGK